MPYAKPVQDRHRHDAKPDAPLRTGSATPAQAHAPARRAKSWSFADSREFGYSREGRKAVINGAARGRETHGTSKTGAVKDAELLSSRPMMTPRHQISANRQMLGSLTKETTINEPVKPPRKHPPGKAPGVIIVDKNSFSAKGEGSSKKSGTSSGKNTSIKTPLKSNETSKPSMKSGVKPVRVTGSKRVLLLACGSFNPITNMHLRMFEIARDALEKSGRLVVAGGIISPVSDSYGKRDLIPAKHRCQMVRLALKDSNWVRLDTWESEQSSWLETARVLQHHKDAITLLQQSVEKGSRNGGDPSPKRKRKHDGGLEGLLANDNKPIELKLLCGADLLESFGTPGLWKNEDIEEIVGKYGLVCISRSGSDPNRFIYENDVLNKHKDNIFIVKEWIQSEISSTKIRRAIRRRESVRYLLQDSVIDYIKTHQLYSEPIPPATRFSHLASPFPLSHDPQAPFNDPRSIIFPSYHPQGYPRLQFSTSPYAAITARKSHPRQHSSSELYAIPDLTSLTCRIKKWKVAMVNETRV